MNCDKLILVLVCLCLNLFLCIGRSPVIMGVHFSGEALKTSSSYDKYVHFNGPGPWLAGETQEAKFKRDYCISFGLDYSYKIAKRYDIEVGLSFLRAHSNSLRFAVSSTGSNWVSPSKLDLNYIMIPISIRYDYYRKSNCYLYYRAGVNGAYCIGGHEEIEHLMVEPTEAELLKDEEYVRKMTNFAVDSCAFQLSVSLKTGIDYIVSHLGSLFAEAGINYHFNDGTEVWSYFQQHPWSPGVAVGIRVFL